MGFILSFIPIFVSSTAWAFEPPLNLRVTGVSSTGVTVQWDLQTPTPVAVRISIGPEPAPTRHGSLPGSVLLTPTPLAGNVTTYTVSNLAAGTHVFIHVAVDHADGSRVEQNVLAKTMGGPRASLSSPIRSVEVASFNMLKLVLANPGTVYNGSALNNNKGAEWQGGTWTVTRRNGNPIVVTNVYRDSRPVGQPDWRITPVPYSNNATVDLDHWIYLELGSKILSAIGENEILYVSHSGATSSTQLTNVIVPFSDRYIESPLIQVNQVGYDPSATQRWAYISLWRGATAGGTVGYIPLNDIPSTVEMIAEPSDPLTVRPIVASGLSVSAKATLGTPTVNGSANNGDETGAEVKQINLASVPEGIGVRYHVRIPGLGVSYPTGVSRAGVLKSFYVMARGLFLNRWGRDISNCAWTDWCGRPADHKVIYTSDANPWDAEVPGHPQDGHVPTGLPKITRALPADFGSLFNAGTGFAGGHHDAGDFDTRRHHTEIAEYLLLAFEIAPNNFPDNQLDLPESGNGIPDILDEAFWNLRSWIYLQDDDGGVRAGAEATKHPQDYYYADTDPLDYWTWMKDPDTTMRSAALFAQCSRLMTPFVGISPQAAIIVPALRARAERAWNSTTAGLKVDGSGNWDPTSTAGPASTMWAAGELLLLTNDAKYKKIFESVMAQKFYRNWDATPGPSAGDELFTQDRFVNFPEYGTRRTGVPPEGQFSHTVNYYAAYAKSPAADPNYKALIQTWAARMANDDLYNFDNFHAHRSAYRLYYWGGTTLPLQELANVFGAMRIGVGDTVKFKNALSMSLDHILGGNPANQTWTTGLGYFPPLEPAHLDSLAFIKDKGLPPMPGQPVFGPVNDKPTVPYNAEPLAGFFPDFGVRPHLLKWCDTRTLIVTNEVGSTMAAMNALLSGVLLSPNATLVPNSWKPGGSNHRNGLADTDDLPTPPPPVAPPHPADVNADNQLILDEATQHGYCWRSAPNIPAGCPTPAATMENAVRAGSLWSATVSGNYRYNPGNTCPACWEPAP